MLKIILPTVLKVLNKTDLLGGTRVISIDETEKLIQGFCRKMSSEATT
jgi:hypothetical protein